MSGDPVGEESEIDALLAELQTHRARPRLAARGRRRLRASTCRATARSASSRSRWGRRPCCGRRSSRSKGRAIRKVRQSVTRLQKAGYSFRVVAADDVSPELEEELADVSAAWRGDQPERGFSMTIDDLHVPGTVLAIAADEHGRIGGFLHLAPSPAGGGWSLSTMRRRPDSPNGLTEFLIVETVEWAKAEGASELSLNFCAFTDVISLERATSIPKRARAARSAHRPTTSSSSSGSTRSTGSSSRSGAAVTSASSGTGTSPPSAWRTSAPSPSSCRPARGLGAARHAGASRPNLLP